MPVNGGSLVAVAPRPRWIGLRSNRGAWLAPSVIKFAENTRGLTRLDLGGALNDGRATARCYELGERRALVIMPNIMP